ncbi:hypothetical protein TrVE_jg139, partial [Triparma verrucosa]
VGVAVDVFNSTVLLPFQGKSSFNGYDVQTPIYATKLLGLFESSDVEDDFDLLDFEDSIGCNEYKEAGNMPLHTSAVWKYLRDVYELIVGEASTIDPDNDGSMSGTKDVEMKVSPGKGRGLFAKRDFLKGDEVFTTIYGGFYDSQAYRDYLRYLSISGNNDLACDVLQWAYVMKTQLPEQIEKTYLKSGLVVGFDINPGSIVNNDNKNPNVGALNGNVARDVHIALRDIRKGEELLASYSAFE